MFFVFFAIVPSKFPLFSFVLSWLLRHFTFRIQCFFLALLVVAGLVCPLTGYLHKTIKNMYSQNCLLFCNRMVWGLSRKAHSRASWGKLQNDSGGFELKFERVPKVSCVTV